MVQDRRLRMCVYLSFLLKIHGKKLKKDREKNAEQQRICVREDDLDQ